MESKTICIIAPSLQNGGIERALTTLSAHFVHRGHKVVYIACRSGNHFFELDGRVIFREPDYKHSTSPVQKLLSYQKTILFIRKQLQEFKPDTILSFGDIINPLVLLANRGLNYPIYISDRISPKQQLGWFKNFMKKITYPNATGIIAQSQNAADYKREVFGDRINIRIIPNSLREIAPVNVVEKKKQVIGVGRLSIEKGFDRLIEAFSKIPNHEDWKLVLVGSGPVRNQLESQSKAMGVAERVIFLGARKDVDQLLAESSIFVIPSRCEGFPNALCEAMASPLPCISFDSISASDLIENRVNGVVVPDGDIDGLAKEIEILMDDEKLRAEYAEKAYNIRERLDKDKVGDMFLNFIMSYE